VCYHASEVADVEGGKPSIAGVDRRMLDRIGDEATPATLGYVGWLCAQPAAPRIGKGDGGRSPINAAPGERIWIEREAPGKCRRERRRKSRPTTPAKFSTNSTIIKFNETTVTI